MRVTAVNRLRSPLSRTATPLSQLPRSVKLSPGTGDVVRLAAQLPAARASRLYLVSDNDVSGVDAVRQLRVLRNDRRRGCRARLRETIER